MLVEKGIREQIKRLYGSEYEIAPLLSGIQLGSLGVKGDDNNIHLIGNASDYILNNAELEQYHRDTSVGKTAAISYLNGATETLTRVGECQFDGETLISGKIQMTFKFISSSSQICKFPDAILHKIKAPEVYAKLVAGNTVIQAAAKAALERVNYRRVFNKRRSLYIAVSVVRCENGFYCEEVRNEKFNEASLQATISKLSSTAKLSLELNSSQNVQGASQVQSELALGVLWLRTDPKEETNLVRAPMPPLRHNSAETTAASKQPSTNAFSSLSVQHAAKAPNVFGAASVSQQHSLKARNANRASDGGIPHAPNLVVVTAPSEDFEDVTYVDYTLEQIAELREIALANFEGSSAMNVQNGESGTDLSPRKRRRTSYSS